MSHQTAIRPLRWCLLVTVLLLLARSPAFSHCDGMDGPVVNAARRALATRDVNLVLIWVQAKDEAEVHRVFDHTLAVRSLGQQAQELADRYFFETLVRLHRAGEGAPYTGLQPGGRDLGRAIPAADRALQEGTAEQLKALLNEAVQKGLQQHFQKVLSKKRFRSDDLAAGREYVEAYVAFVHYVERVFEASARAAHGHFHESEDSVEGHAGAAGVRSGSTEQ